MKATKLIKDYVAKKVNEAYPKTAEELAWEELENKMHKAQNKADEIIREFAKKVIADLNAENGFEDDYALEMSKYYSIITHGYCNGSNVYDRSCKAKEERKKKISETVEEILINLELGGTRKDLDEMLANLGK